MLFAFCKFLNLNWIVEENPTEEESNFEIKQYDMPQMEYVPTF